VTAQWHSSYETLSAVSNICYAVSESFLIANELEILQSVCSGTLVDTRGVTGSSLL
jgi:hypothetical protein